MLVSKVSQLKRMRQVHGQLRFLSEQLQANERLTATASFQNDTSQPVSVTLPYISQPGASTALLVAFRSRLIM